MIGEMEKIKEMLIDIYLEALSLGLDLDEVDFWVLKVKSDARVIAEELFNVKKKVSDDE